MGMSLSPLFSNGMIIQQGVPFPVRGRSKVSDTGRVSVIFSGNTYYAQPDQEGKWQLTLDPVPAGGPYTMGIESAEEKITIEDIYSGDVWLCSGQSNMEMQMERLRDDFSEEWMPREFPPIRQFKVPQEWDFTGPREDLQGGSWIAAAKENLHEFSGTAWFFAKKMYEKYHIPIGLICTAWGGTPVESWMSGEALVNFPFKIAQGAQYADPTYCTAIASQNIAEIQEWEEHLIREDRGLSEKWQKPETDISGWDTLDLPGNFAEAELSGERPLVRFCGIIWLCREFDASADLAACDAKLWLGTITDADTVYINGVETGNTGYRYPPRKYRIPAGLLHEGKNRIVIRVNCASGDGGITRGKPFRVFSETTPAGCLELAGTWKYRIGAVARCNAPRPEAFFFQRQPMGTFNAMIAPVLQYPLKGVIWYQGESNDPNPREYAVLFKAMIQDWRNKSGQKNLPFLFVQLPIFGSPAENNEASSWAIIREAQKDALSLPATGMAAGLDLGEWNDLHPINKKDVGFRLFLAAEQTVFNNKNTSPGPMLMGLEQRQNRLFLTFANCGSGLRTQGQAFVSVTTGSSQHRLPADIEGPDTVSVNISSIEHERPEKILYAWENNPRDRQLFNSEGLPMIPFRFIL
ncbi:MAG: hypothetical protein LBH97_04855 [Treponema sp.]|jgi:sialate O-acetylesterase|nr:hypothetical protein [Treponema sp.]